jgi:hypothetical protein
VTLATLARELARERHLNRQPSRPPQGCRLELGAAGSRVAGDERERVHQAELAELPRRHLRRLNVATLDGALEASVCCPLRRHSDCRWGDGFVVSHSLGRKPIKDGPMKGR